MGCNGDEFVVRLVHEMTAHSDTQDVLTSFAGVQNCPFDSPFRCDPINCIWLCSYYLHGRGLGGICAWKDDLVNLVAVKLDAVVNVVSV